MHLFHLFPATLLVVAGLTPASAADLSRIERTLKDEPKYNTRAPKYCLLVFGPEAKTLVWLVHDGDVVHVLDSPDGKSPKKWRQVRHQYYNSASFTLGDVWEEGGKVRHKNLRYTPRSRYQMLWVEVAGKQQVAGRDIRGKLAFAASAKAAPVVHFNGPLELDLFHEQQPLWSNTDIEITAVVGTRGVGLGTFALFRCNAYPKGAWPTALIEFPGTDKRGKPIVVKVRLAEE